MNRKPHCLRSPRFPFAFVCIALGAASHLHYATAQEAPPFEEPEAMMVRLAPIGNGRGIVVCEPTAAETDEATANFGAGCGRWLHLTLAGQPELGATPTWGEIDMARRELGSDDLRLNVAQAAKLRGMLGISHVAVGSIKGTLQHCRLSYQLRDLAKNVPVGPPLEIEGAPEAILKQLPRLAGKLAVALGVDVPIVPSAASISASDIAFLGSISWKAEPPLSADSVKRLQILARTDALGALTLLQHKDDLSLSDAQIVASAQDALAIPAINLAAVSAIVLGCPRASNELLDKASASWFAKVPRNYQVLAAAMRREAARQQWIKQRGDAESAVRIAPLNPGAWLRLADAISEATDSVRHARTIGGMNDAELAQVEVAYPLWQASVRRATQLDPHSSRAWYSLSISSAFMGDGDTADSALAQSMQCTPLDDNVYFWCVQLYEYKWFPDKDKERRMIDFAMDGNDRQFDKAITGVTEALAKELSARQPLDNSETKLIAKVALRSRAWFAAGPHKSSSLDQVAYFYEVEGDFAEAITIYKESLRQNPDNAVSHAALGYCLEQSNDLAGAITEYKAACRLDPKNEYALQALARYGQAP